MATKKHRSPGYPAIDLRAAVTLAQKVYPAAKNHLGADVVAQEWGYSNRNTASPHIAAVKYFGLLIEENGTKDRMLRLSELALDILVDPDGSTNERRRALETAALKPRLHSELWEKWGANLPPDGEIRRYLERERDFNPKYVEKFIAQFKATMAFSGLAQTDIIDPEDGAEDNHIGGSGMDNLARTLASAETIRAAAPTGGMRDFPVPLISGGIAVLRVPFPMRKDDFEQLKATLDTFEKALVGPDPNGARIVDPDPPLLEAPSSDIAADS